VNSQNILVLAAVKIIPISATLKQAVTCFRVAKIGIIYRNCGGDGPEGFNNSIRVQP
jgi:hypothetical protein